MTVAATNSSATYGISPKVSDAQSPDTIQFSPPLDQSLNSPPGLPMRKYSSSTNIDFPRNFNVDDSSTLSKRLASSAEGKFTIIDSRYKESTDESFDDSSDVEFEISNDAKLSKSPSAFCIGLQTTSTHLDPTRSYPNFRKMAAQNICGSRFKIVPVESRYKRGRWQAWDYYLDDNKKAIEDKSLFKKAAVHLTGDGFLNQNIANNGQSMGQSHPVINPPKMIAIVPPTPPIVGSSSASMFSETRKFDDNINSFAFGTPPTSSPNFYIPSENSTIHSVSGQQMLMQGLLTNQEVPLSSRAVSVGAHRKPEIFGSRPNSPENVHDQLRVDVYSSKGASSPAINISPISATSSESRPSPENGPPPQMSGGRLTPSAEILLQHYGLERSLSATSSYHDPSLLDLLPGTIHVGSPQNAPILSDKVIEELKNRLQEDDALANFISNITSSNA
ncbi:hypothetical protein Ddc_03160 [Ditylenchus destructor]|nr:hypothetical protein Ddc_03160 [Ditylenchus destructor]